MSNKLITVDQVCKEMVAAANKACAEAGVDPRVFFKAIERRVKQVERYNAKKAKQ